MRTLWATIWQPLTSITPQVTSPWIDDHASCVAQPVELRGDVGVRRLDAIAHRERLVLDDEDVIELRACRQ